MGDDITDVIAKISVISTPFSLIMQIGVGPLYDVFGRKIPVASAMFLGAASQAIIAFAVNVFPMYVIGYIMSFPLLFTNTCPYIPDLI